MALIEKSEIRNVSGITPEQRFAICKFLQEAVDCWCKNHPDEWFAMRDLVGRSQLLVWDDTPLVVLYEKYIDLGNCSEDAVKKAGVDSGWLLKKVIDDDEREFDTKIEEQVRKYKWDDDTSIKC